jgi:predicted RNase H-like HicB family nuclease
MDQQPIPRMNLLACLAQRDQETNLYQAHCLNFDLVESGETWEEAWANLERVLKYHIEYCCMHNREGLAVTARTAEWDQFIKAFQKDPKSVVVKSIEIELGSPLPQREIPIWIQGVNLVACNASFSATNQGQTVPF